MDIHIDIRARTRHVSKVCHMYMCVWYIYIYLYIYISIHMYIYIYIDRDRYTRANSMSLRCAICVCVCVIYIYIYISIYLCIYIYIYIIQYIRARTRHVPKVCHASFAQMYPYIYTYINIYTSHTHSCTHGTHLSSREVIHKVVLFVSVSTNITKFNVYFPRTIQKSKCHWYLFCNLCVLCKMGRWCRGIWCGYGQ